MEKRVNHEQKVFKRTRDEIEKRTGKTPEQLYAEREKRITDVIHLKVPDRMPVWLQPDTLARKYAGLPRSAPFYDPAALTEAFVKILLDFDPDFCGQQKYYISGLALEKLGAWRYLWPGGNLQPDQETQFIDVEIMKEDEYDLFITDPGDFILRYFLPREWKALEPLSNLPPLRYLMGGDGRGSGRALAVAAASFISPEIIQAAEALFKAGQEQAKYDQEVIGPQQICVAMGIPPLWSGGGGEYAYADSAVVTPFDVIADVLRGTRGIAIDMFKRPEKLQAAMERILEWSLARVAPAPSKERGRIRVFGGGAHYGSAAFLSRKQFETFYWPTWKKSILAVIDLGFIPVLFPEGNSDDRIECFLELPKGKALLCSQKIDAFRAKEILGGHLSFMGGVPPALLWGGSPQEVNEYCKNLIKVVGKDGGYILSSGGGEADGKLANIKAMVDAVKKYGRY